MLNNGQEPELMVIEKLLSEKLFLDNRPPDTQLSVTRIVKFHVPAADGVPLIRPAELMPRPEGNDPETMLKVMGACPPDTAT
jgi:hypothetical protein